jgi:glutaredoxin 3
MQIAKIVIFIIALLTITTNLYDTPQMATPNTPADIIIYSKDYCPYCVKAKQLLESKDLKYLEIGITHDDELREQMLAKSNGSKTVPQIFINNQHIGGFSDLYALEESGELDKIITSIRSK